jgi:hypothetical protein
MWYFFILSPSVTQSLIESSCDELLIQIKTSTPNYQYDLREWVSKECSNHSCILKNKGNKIRKEIKEMNKTKFLGNIDTFKLVIFVLPIVFVWGLYGILSEEPIQQYSKDFLIISALVVTFFCCLGVRFGTYKDDE